MLQIIGWIGSICLALCPIPFAWQSYKEKKSTITKWGLILWMVGELCTAAYILPKKDYPLLLNYGLNIICLMVVVKYKLYPKDIPL